MSATTLSANQILNFEFGQTSFSATSTFYVGLSLNLTSYSGSGALEPGDTYVRVAVPNDKSHWSTATSGSLYNSASIVFPQSSGSWGTVQEVDLYSAASGSNIRHRVVLASPRTISGSSVFSLVPGALTFSLV
jgi:hypothetical protein